MTDLTPILMAGHLALHDPRLEDSCDPFWGRQRILSDARWLGVDLSGISQPFKDSPEGMTRSHADEVTSDYVNEACFHGMPSFALYAVLDVEAG